MMQQTKSGLMVDFDVYFDNVNISPYVRTGHLRDGGEYGNFPSDLLVLELIGDNSLHRLLTYFFARRFILYWGRIFQPVGLYNINISAPSSCLNDSHIYEIDLLFTYRIPF